MIMKRLALVTMTAFLAVVLSACGERVEKRTDTTTTTDTNQPAQTAPADNSTTTTETTKTNP